MWDNHIDVAGESSACPGSQMLMKRKLVDAAQILELSVLAVCTVGSFLCFRVERHDLSRLADFASQNLSAAAAETLNSGTGNEEKTLVAGTGKSELQNAVRYDQVKVERSPASLFLAYDGHGSVTLDCPKLFLFCIVNDPESAC